VSSDVAEVSTETSADAAGSEDASESASKDSEEAPSEEDGASAPEDGTAEVVQDIVTATDSVTEDAQAPADIEAEDAATEDSGSGPADDAAVEADVPSELDTVEDAEASSDAQEAEDIEAPEDTEEPEDTGTPAEDIAAEDVAEEDTGDVGPMCDPEGTWTLETTTAALPGEGCAPNGEPAQGPNTKTFTVTQNPDGSLVGVLPEVSEPIPEITVTQLPDEDCRFEFVVALSIYFPSLGGEPPSTAYLTYTYTVALADGGVHGSGTVYTATIFEDGEIQQECTEAITIGGGFVPLGG
jgi:hypothetical protein